jgi:glyoxylase-like metal-dependent hydrolase (beta-lactamase superfamily II)
MTHLHFDHCGGSVQWNKTGYEPAFKTLNGFNDHWEWATKPNPREKHPSCRKFYQCKKVAIEFYQKTRR